MRTALLAFGLLGSAAAVSLTGFSRRPERPPSLSVNWYDVLVRHRELPAAAEPSTRLAVPGSLTEDVWSYLSAQHPGLHTRVWQNTDWYYDTRAGHLAEQWLAVRLRTGDGVPKVQVKAYHRVHGHAAEITLNVVDTTPRSLWTLVAERDRLMLTDALRIFGVDPEELAPGPPLWHARRDFALTRGATEMAVSLDHLTWDGGEHDVLELTPLANQNDHSGVEQLVAELRTVFPVLQVDPTPKAIAARQRNVVRDHNVCVWRAAQLMCKPAAVAEPTPVPAFLPSPPAARPQSHRAPTSLTPSLSGASLVAPFGTGRWPVGIGNRVEQPGTSQLETPVY